MTTIIIPQRPPVEGDSLGGSLGPRHRIRNWTWIRYSHTVTAEEAGYLEWWFPYVAFGGNDVVIHSPTLGMSANIGAPKEVYLFAQSPSDDVRILLHEFSWQAGKQFAPTYTLPTGSRGILTFNSILEGTVLDANYLIEVEHLS
jgi:hypothetical protein